MTGRYALLAVVRYGERLRPGRLAGWSAGLIVWGAIVFSLAEATGVAASLRAGLAWLPSWFLHPAEFDEIVAMGAPQLVIFLTRASSCTSR